MGGHPYFYFVPYDDDPQRALDELREREFQAGRYNPVLRFIQFDEPAFSAQQPGAQHDSIEEALDASDADGTRSILDISTISPRRRHFAAAPLSPKELQAFFGTDRPTRAMVESSDGLFESIERGQCIYCTVYAENAPRYLYFAGYSFD